MSIAVVRSGLIPRRSREYQGSEALDTLAAPCVARPRLRHHWRRHHRFRAQFVRPNLPSLPLHRVRGSGQLRHRAPSTTSHSQIHALGNTLNQAGFHQGGDTEMGDGEAAMEGNMYVYSLV